MVYGVSDAGGATGAAGEVGGSNGGGSSSGGGSSGSGSGGNGKKTTTTTIVAEPQGLVKDASGNAEGVYVWQPNERFPQWVSKSVIAADAALGLNVYSGAGRSGEATSNVRAEAIQRAGGATREQVGTPAGIAAGEGFVNRLQGELKAASPTPQKEASSPAVRANLSMTERVALIEKLDNVGSEAMSFARSRDADYFMQTRGNMAVDSTMLDTAATMQNSAQARVSRALSKLRGGEASPSTLMELQEFGGVQFNTREDASRFASASQAVASSSKQADALEHQGEAVFGGTLLSVGTSQYTPSPFKPKGMIDVYVPNAFGIKNGILGAAGVAETIAIRQSGVIIGETASSSFGMKQVVHGIPQPIEVNQTILTSGGTGVYPKSTAEAWQWKASQSPVQLATTSTASSSPLPASILGDLDTRYQGMIREGKSIFFGNKPNESSQGGMQKAFMWGAAVGTLEFGAVELTKLAAGLDIAVYNWGSALRYGEPSVSPYIKFTQSLTGTTPSFSTEQTWSRISEGAGGAVGYFRLPVELIALETGRKYIVGGATGIVDAVGSLPVIKGVSSFVLSKLPFSISSKLIVKSATSAPIFYGAVSGISMYSATEGDVPVSAGAAFGAMITIKGYERIGEGIIARNKAASSTEAYSQTGFWKLIDRNFVQTKTYSSPEAAAKFYTQSSPKEFVAAIKEGSKYGAYQSEAIPRWKSVPAAGQENLFPRVGEFVMNPKHSETGFSKEEFQLALAKRQGKEIPPMYTSVPISGMESKFPMVGELVRNPEDLGVSRSTDFVNAFKDAADIKPTFAEWTQMQVAGIADFTGETVVKVSGRGIRKLFPEPSVKMDIKIPEVKEVSGYKEPEVSQALKDAWNFESSTAGKTSKQKSALPKMETSEKLLAEIKPRLPRVSAYEINMPYDISVSRIEQTIRDSQKISQRSELHQGLRESVKQDLKQEMRQDLKIDLITPLRTDMRQDLRMNLRQDLISTPTTKLITTPRLDIKNPTRTKLKFDFTMGDDFGSSKQRRVSGNLPDLLSIERGIHAKMKKMGVK